MNALFECFQDVLLQDVGLYLAGSPEVKKAQAKLACLVPQTYNGRRMAAEHCHLGLYFEGGLKRKMQRSVRPSVEEITVWAISQKDNLHF